MTTPEWRREVELRKMEQLERRLEAEDLMREEELKLLSVAQQVRNVNARLEETRAELTKLELSQQVTRSIEITENDEIDLAREFSKSIFRVLDNIRSVGEGSASAGGAEDASSEQEQKDAEEADQGEGEGEGEEEDAYDARDKPGSSKGESSADGEESLADADKAQSQVAWVLVQWSEEPSWENVDAEVMVRLHDVYSFQDLKEDVCRHLELRTEPDSLEVCSPGRMKGWPDEGIVIAEIRKGELVNTDAEARQQGVPPVVRLRFVPPVVKLAQVQEVENEEEKEMRNDITQKAALARRSAHYLRSIALARKRSRHARSLIIRGAVHVSFTLMFAISIATGNTRGYQTVSAVRNALNKRFSAEPDWIHALSCKQLAAGSYFQQYEAAGLPKAKPHFGLTLDEVTSPEGVAAWMRGALVDALAPRCYKGKDTSFDPNASGTIGFYLNMITPLRLQQTRYAEFPDCAQFLSVQNYPNLDPAIAAQRTSPYPPCGSVTERSTKPFGDLTSEGFTYTPDEDPSYTTEESRYRYAGTFGEYGPGGYIRDIWAAADYRAQIADLLSSGWIDGWTESVAAHLQLVNAQTGCLVVATALFEFNPAGGVQSSLSVTELCEPIDAPKRSIDFTQLFEFDYLSPFEVFVFFLCCLYVFRVGFVQYRAYKRWDEGESLVAQLTTMAYVQDTVLGLLMLAYLGEVFFAWSRHTSFLEMLRKSRYDPMPPDLLARVDAIVASLTSGEMASALGADQRAAALSSLKNAFYLSAVWDGTPYGFEVLDLHAADPKFVSYADFCESSIHIRGLRSLVLMAALVKGFRYAQAWRPLASRYAGIAQNMSYITRFFLILVHFHLCFSLQANLVFGPELVEFQSVTSSFLQLLQLLTGKIAVAYKLIELDTRSNSFVGQMFLLLFMVVLVLSGSSLIISVLAEGWSNATEVLRRRRETKQRLRSLENFSRQAAELELIKASTAELGETELDKLAREADRAAEAGMKAVRRYSQLMRLSKQVEKRREGSPKSAMRHAQQGVQEDAVKVDRALKRSESMLNRLNRTLRLKMAEPTSPGVLGQLARLSTISFGSADEAAQAHFAAAGGGSAGIALAEVAATTSTPAALESAPAASSAAAVMPADGVGRRTGRQRLPGAPAPAETEATSPTPSTAETADAQNRLSWAAAAVAGAAATAGAVISAEVAEAFRTDTDENGEQGALRDQYAEDDQAILEAENYVRRGADESPPYSDLGGYGSDSRPLRENEYDI